MSCGLYHSSRPELKVKQLKHFDTFLNFAIGVKTLWNVKVKMISIIVENFGTVQKNMEKTLDYVEITGRLETIQIIALLKALRKLRNALEN